MQPDPSSPLFRLFEIITRVSLLLCFILVFYYYKDLPQLIPTHYNFGGVADNYSEKWLIWVLPVVAGVVYTLLGFTERHQETVNHPVPVKESNKAALSRITYTLLQSMKVVLMANFAYLTYATVKNALGQMDGLGWAALPLLILSVLIIVGLYLYRVFRLK